MLGQLRKLGKQTAIYGFGNILNKLLGFILIPLYNNFIPIASFGNLAVMETTILLLTAILHFGIYSGHQRYFFIEKESGNYGTFLFNNYLGNFVLTIISVVPLLLFSEPIAYRLFSDPAFAGNLRLVFWIVVAEIMCVIPFQILQFEEKPGQYLLFNAFKLTLSFLLTIYFVKKLTMGINGILVARLAGATLTAVLFLLLVILPRIRLKFDLSRLWISVKYGFPAIAGNIGFLIFQLNDRYMLNWLSTSAETGKYAFGYKIANFINLIFISTIGLSYMPSIFSKEKEENNTRYYRKMLTYYCFLISLIILGFLFFYKDLLSLVARNKDYFDGLSVVPVLSFSFMVLGMNYFVGVGLYLKNRMIYFLAPSLAAVVSNILLNWFLIPRIGIMGAAWSSLISQALYTGILSFTASRFIKISFEWGKILMIYLLAVALFMASQATEHLGIILSYGLKLLLLVLFPLVLYLFKFFEKVEIQRIREGMSKIFDRYNPLQS